MTENYYAGNTNITKNVTVRDLTIDCNYIGVNAIVFAGVENGLIDNIYVINPRVYGIWLLRSGENLFFAGNPTKHVNVINCHLIGIRDTGVEIWGGEQNVVANNYVSGYNATGGFFVWGGSQNNLICNNISEGIGNYLTNNFKAFGVQPTCDTCPSINTNQTKNNTFISNIARNALVGYKMSGFGQNRAEMNDFSNNQAILCVSAIELLDTVLPIIRDNKFINCVSDIRIYKNVENPIIKDNISIKNGKVEVIGDFSVIK